MANTQIPNIVYQDEKTTIGYLQTHQDFLNFHVSNGYCIQNPRRFEAYIRAGYNLYLIDNGLDDDFLRYAIVMIKRGNGKKTYWGMDDIPMNASGQREFENTLSDDGLAFINNICSKLTTENIYNTMKNKKVIRLTESDLHLMIEEAVKQVIRESDDFISHAFKPTNNYTGNGLQVSDDGSMARLQFPNGEVTDWLEVEFDENGVAYVITPDGEEERLDEYMRCGGF